VQWLRKDELRTPWLVWIIALAWVITASVMVLTGGPETAVMLTYASIPFGFLIKILFAMQACRFFAEARASGALELLLCTPLTDKQVISGQMRAQWTAFGGPLLLFLAGLFVPLLIKTVLLLKASQLQPLAGTLGGAVLGAIQVLRMTADLFALQWVGMALALTGKRPRLAPAFTILWVLVVPSVFCWLDALVDLLLIAWGSSKCRQNLRRIVAEQYQVRDV